MKILSALLMLTVTGAMASAQQTAGVVTGQVLEQSTRRAVSMAIVELVGGAGATMVRSDSMGRYRLQGVAPGRYQLRVRRLGYLPLMKDSVSVVAAESTAIDFMLGALPVVQQSGGEVARPVGRSRPKQ